MGQAQMQYDWCPYRKREIRPQTEIRTGRRRPCEDGGRDWGGASTSQGTTRVRGKEGLSLGDVGMSRTPPAPRCQILASRTGTDYSSVVLSLPVSGSLLRRPQKTSAHILGRNFRFISRPPFPILLKRKQKRPETGSHVPKITKKCVPKPRLSPGLRRSCISFVSLDAVIIYYFRKKQEAQDRVCFPIPAGGLFLLALHENSQALGAQCDSGGDVSWEYNDAGMVWRSGPENHSLSRAPAGTARFLKAAPCPLPGCWGAQGDFPSFCHAPGRGKGREEGRVSA